MGNSTQASFSKQVDVYWTPGRRCCTVEFPYSVSEPRTILSRGEWERRGDSAKPLPYFTLSYTASFQGVQCFPDENSVFLLWCNSFWYSTTTRDFLVCFTWVISSKYRCWKEKEGGRKRGRKEKKIRLILAPEQLFLPIGFLKQN